jgi:hypothetical protein
MFFSQGSLVIQFGDRIVWTALHRKDALHPAPFLLEGDLVCRLTVPGEFHAHHVAARGNDAVDDFLVSYFFAIPTREDALNALVLREGSIVAALAFQSSGHERVDLLIR